MKKVKILLLLVIVAAVLFGIYYALGRNAQRQAEEEAEQQAAQQTENTVLYTTEDLGGIQYSYAGEQLHFVKIGDHWHHNDIADFTVNSDLLANMELMAANITGRLVDGGDELFHQVGLNEPQLRITFNDKAYVSKTLCFGMKNQVTGEYYACVEGETEVYLVSADIVEAFLYTTEELRGTESAE